MHVEELEPVLPRVTTRSMTSAMGEPTYTIPSHSIVRQVSGLTSSYNCNTYVQESLMVGDDVPLSLKQDIWDEKLMDFTELLSPHDLEKCPYELEPSDKSASGNANSKRNRYINDTVL